MNIACIIHSLDGGGAERVMAALASRLAQRGHRVTLITLDDGSHARHAIDDRVERRWLDVMGPSRGWVAKFLNTRWRIRTLRDAIADCSPDVILSFCDRTNILTLMAADTLATPVVVSERSDPSQQKLGRSWEYLRDRTYRRANVIVALTETSARYLSNRFVDNRIAIIPSATDPPPFSVSRDHAIRNRRIVGVGRLEVEKGFDRLIDAFACLAGDHPEWSLRILGDGSQRESLQQQARGLSVEDRLGMPGWVGNVWDELAGATIFALPSRYEGFPSALLEAMAMGIPSVAVDCESGPRALIKDARCGLLVPNETAALANGLRRLIEDAGHREQVGEGGQYVVEQFGWETMVDQYENVLLEVVNNARRHQEGQLRT